MKRLGEMFRGRGEEQKYIVEVGRSELEKLEAVASIPLNVIRMVTSLHWTAEQLNDFLRQEPPETGAVE